MTEHTSVRIPRPLKKKADQKAEELDGYSNGAELIRDTLRHGLKDYQGIKESILNDEEFLEELKEKIKD